MWLLWPTIHITCEAVIVYLAEMLTTCFLFDLNEAFSIFLMIIKWALNTEDINVHLTTLSEEYAGSKQINFILLHIGSCFTRQLQFWIYY